MIGRPCNETITIDELAPTFYKPPVFSDLYTGNGIDLSFVVRGFHRRRWRD
jgi:hypothetical protein